MKSIKQLLPVLVSSSFLLTGVSHSALASDLASVDAFHPPVGGDLNSLLYQELHSFTVRSSRKNIHFSTVQALQGDITNPYKSYAVDVQNFTTPDKSDLTAAPFPIFQAQWSATSPDLTIGNSSIDFENGVYSVRTVSPDAQTVMDAVFTPMSAYDEPIAMTGLPAGIAVNWLVSAPVNSVNGTITVNSGTEEEVQYPLENEGGYHDHVWGTWSMGMDIGWSYGHGIEGRCVPSKKSWECRNGKAAHTLSLLSLTNKNDTSTYSTAMNLWQGSEKLGSFRDDQVRVEKELMPVEGMPGLSVPATSTLIASNGADYVRAVFTTEDYAPLYVPMEGGYRILWQLSGSFKVKGMINGKKVKFHSDGNIEYLSTPLLTQ